jgi:hypothetical protein
MVSLFSGAGLAREGLLGKTSGAWPPLSLTYDRWRGMKEVRFTVEVVDGRLWSRLSTSQAPGTARLHELLRWIIEQINFGNFDFAADASGALTGLVLGAPASSRVDDSTVEQVAAHVRERMYAVNVARLFAGSREQGVLPEYAELAEKVRNTIESGGRDNTDLHYALELVKALERISAVTFVFTSPPIRTRAGAGVVALLQEATRAYLFGLVRACVAVCRALLEEALGELLTASEREQARGLAGKGELEAMIDVAREKGYLSETDSRKAHTVRKAGNRALHRAAAPNDTAAWRVLEDTRAVLGVIYSTKGRAI